MKEKIKKLIKQYITCKHEDFTVIRQIWFDSKHGLVEYIDRRKCNTCGREYYSDFYIEVDGIRHYSNKRILN